MKFTSILTASAISITLLTLSGVAYANNLPQVDLSVSNCQDLPNLISQRTTTTTNNNNERLTQPSGNGTEKKTCETTNAPATNEQGENGTNRCTSCSYSNGGFTVNCVFIKTN